MISAYSSLLIAGLCVGVNSKPDVEIEFYGKFTVHCQHRLSLILSPLLQ